MDLTNFATVVDLFASALIIGATSWFFFVQSPVLLARLGREKFVPIQMRLTVVLFKTLQVFLIVAVGAALVHRSLASPVVIAAAVGLFGGLVNAHVIVPRALRAGGRSRKEIEGQDADANALGFASEGAGDATRTFHRLVVLFVVIMLAGVGTHMTLLLP